MEHNRMDVEEQAAEWVAELEGLRGKTGRVIQARFDIWQRRSEAHVQAYRHALRTFHALDGLRCLPAPEVAGRLDRFRSGQWLLMGWHRPRRLIGMTAVLLMMLVLPLDPQVLIATPMFYSTDVGEQRTVTLDDDVELRLSPKTRVLVQRMGRVREIDVLQGETFIHLPIRSHRPTHVYTPLVHIVPEAGEFDVLHTAEATRVVSLQGRLSIFPFGSPKAILNPERLHLAMIGGDVATLRCDDEAVDVNIQNHSAPELDGLLAWRHGLLAFQNETTQDVADMFNRYNREQIVIADVGIAMLRLSGSFALNDPRSFVLALQRVHSEAGIVAEQQPRVLLLRRTGSDARTR